MITCITNKHFYIQWCRRDSTERHSSRSRWQKRHRRDSRDGVDCRRSPDGSAGRYRQRRPATPQHAGRYRSRSRREDVQQSGRHRVQCPSPGVRYSDSTRRASSATVSTSLSSVLPFSNEDMHNCMCIQTF